MKIRGFLEFKNGEFRDKLEVLAQPDTWKDLTPSTGAWSSDTQQKR